MEKPLHDDIEAFFTLREGKLRRFIVGDIGWLLSAANDAPEIEHRKIGEITFTYKNGVRVAEVSSDEIFCAWVKHYLEWIVAEGVTKNMVDELNDLLSDVRYIHLLSVSEKGVPYWQRDIADMETGSTPPEVAAYAVSHHLAAGGLESLKRCKLSDCGKFYVGSSNKKWCSESCGAKHRVRQKRKRDQG